MYLRLAAAQADTVDVLTDTTAKLIRAQREAEDMLLSAPDAPVRLVQPETQE